MSLHSITDTMIKTAETNAETIASQDRTIHNLTFLLSGARQTIDELRTELATANATIAQLNDNLYEAAQVADTDNETVAALVSQIEDEKIVALRAELAAANAEIVGQKMTIKTLSEHIANSIDDGEDWLDSYVGKNEEDEDE
jgi:uncharacterized coiled-coil protein SlyX